MADNRKNGLVQYDFDEEWDVERELYGHLLNKGRTAEPEPFPVEDTTRKQDISIDLPPMRSHGSSRDSGSVRSRDRDVSQRSFERTSVGNTKEKKETGKPPLVIPVGNKGSAPGAGRQIEKRTEGSTRMPPQPRRTTAQSKGKKKSQIDYVAWAKLIGLALGALLVLALLIWFIVWAVTPGDRERNKDREDTTTVETIPTTTVDYEALARELLEKAELQCAMYDYDTAIATVKSFGSDWATRSELSQAVQKYEQLKSQTVRWEDTTTIPHIFFHILVADNARAFDGDYTEDGYNQYMTTIPEFNAILEELYAKDYVLVRIHDIAQLTTDENGKQVYRQGDIYLPEGKKPIIISQDDVNFYEYMIDSDGDHLPDAGGDGFASKLLVDAHGDITCEYVTAEGDVVYGDYDMVPILERFVEKHPDFSYRGAKAIVALTGYEGVYGYRTDKDGKARLTPTEFQKEIDGAKKVNKWLKDNGWEIASHSYGHPAYGSLTWEELAHDVSRWEEEVQPVVGDTDIFIYPYGSDIAGVENYSGAKYDTMYEAGYRFYCNVDSSEYWVHIRDNYVRQGRRNLDGYRMWYDPELLDDLFDATAIFDPDRPTPVPPI